MTDSLTETLPDARRLVLPPPYTAHRIAAGDVLDEAVRRAAEEGAGFLVWRFGRNGQAEGRLDFAVVLEPTQPLSEARLAAPLAMVALADAIGAHCPPEREVTFVWPGEVRFDGARLGGLRLSVAPGCAETDVPDWMVVAVDLIADRDHLRAPGEKPASISLAEEGFPDPLAVLESFAAHLMLNFDRWKHQGWDDVAARYAKRLEAGKLSATGDLILDDGTRRLADALSAPAWRDASGPIL